MTTTPDTRSDLAQRLAEVLPAHYRWNAGGRNVWVGEEQPAGGVVLARATFVRVVGEVPLLYHGGQARWFSLQVLARHEPTPEEIVLAEARARATYDALQSVPFTGASGTSYLDCLYLDAPRLLTDAYFVHNLQLLADT